MMLYKFISFTLSKDVPNSGKKLVRLDYRRKWNADLKSYLKKLDEKKPVIFCGDLNVSHLEIGENLFPLVVLTTD